MPSTPSRTPRKQPSRHSTSTTLTNTTPSKMNVNGTTPRKTPRKNNTPRKTPAKKEKEKLRNDQGEEGIQVAIRMRPLNRNEGNHKRVWKVLPQYSAISQMTTSGKPLPERVTGRNFFNYDQTFGEESATGQVYDSICKDIVTSAVTGLNGTIFAYGQTSSGKTYTMQGSGTIEEGSRVAADGTVSHAGGGIVHMAAADIFRHVESQPDRVFLVRASFLEIYNEEVRDLLTKDNQVLQIREDPRRGVFVQSEEEIVTDFESLLSVLITGEKSRTFASTSMNERSSRSHTIFRITIESRSKPTEGGEENDDSSGGDGAVLVSTLNLVDLAGSESVRHTGATGDRQKEGGMINQSLLTLSRVIVALGTPNQTHINFRDSKLTRILQPSLSGNARMAVICCATPSELYLEETRSTLQFASRAKLVKTRAQVNEVLDDRSIIRRLQRELALARHEGGAAAGEQKQEQFQALEQKATIASTAAQEAEAKLRRLQASILNSEGLFGSKSIVAVEHDAAVQPRKRRLSDGAFGLGSSTPMKGVMAGASPKTMPRANKRSKKESTKSLSPSTELGLLREALMAKKDMVRTWQKKASEISRLVEGKESELISVNCSNDILRSERDAAKEDVVSSIATLRQEMEAMSAAHEAALQQKETAIEKSLAKLEAELEDRKILEETVDTLQEDKAAAQQQLDLERETTTRLVSENESLQETVQILETKKEIGSAEKEDLNTKFMSLQAELDRSAFELDQSKGEQENLVKAREEDSERLQDLHGKMEFLASTILETHEEKNQALEEMKSLEKQLDKSQQELQSRSVALEDAAKGTDKLNETIAGLNEQVKELSMELEEWEDKCQREVTEKESIDASLTAAKETIEVLQQDQLARLDEISELHEKFEGVSTELDQSKGDLAISKSNISNLEISFDELTAERDNTRELWEASKGYLEEAQQKIYFLEASFSQSEMDKAALTEKIRELSKELAATTEMVTELESAASDSEIQCQGLKANLVVLQTQIDTLETQIAQSNQERDNIQSELEASNEKVDDMEATIAGMKVVTSEQLKSLSIERDTAIGHTKELETQLDTANEERDVSRSELDASHAKVVELVAAINSFEEIARETSLQMKSLSGEKETALADVTLLESKLKEICEGHDVAQSVLEASNSKIDALVTEQGELQSRNNTLEAQLVDNTQAIESARSELEAEINMVATLTATIENLKSTVDETSTQLGARSGEKDSALARAYELETQLREMNAKVDIAQARSDALDAQLADKIQDLETARSELEADANIIDELTATLETLKSTANETSMQLEARCEEKDSAFKRANELENQLREMNDKIDIAQSYSDTLGDQLAEKTQELDETLLQLKSSNGKVAKLTVTVDNIKLSTGETSTRLEALLSGEKEAALYRATELESQLGKLDEKIDIAQSEIEYLVEKMAGQTLELVSARSELEGGAARVVELCATIENHESTKNETAAKLEAISKERDAVLNRAIELETQLQEMEDKIVHTQSLRDTADVELIDKTQELDETRSKLEASNLKVTELSTAVENLKATMDGTSSALAHATDLDRTIKQMEEELERTTKAAAALRDDNELLESKLLSQGEALAASHASEDALKSEFEETKLKLNSVSSEYDGLLSKIAIVQKDLQARTNELISVHDQLESSNARLTDTNKRNNDLEDEFESKESMFSQSLATLEEERNNLVSQLQEQLEVRHGLEGQIALLTSSVRELTEKQAQAEQQAAGSSQVDFKIEVLRNENNELKQLLSVSNSSIEEAREAAHSADAELEEREKQLENARAWISQQEEAIRLAGSTLGGSDELSIELERLQEEKRQLEEALDNEAAERQQSEEKLRLQMGDEQRALIQEAESSMQKLRKKLAAQEEAMKRSEAEAYTAREDNEELRDQGKRALQNAIQIESRVAALQNENARLKQASVNESEVASLALQLKKAKAERATAHQSLAKLENKLRLVDQEKNEKVRDLSSVLERMSRQDIPALEKENKRLQEEVQTLSSQAAAMREQFSESTGNRAEIGSLQTQLSELAEKLKSKDDRIKKLNGSKLTKDQVAAIKKMKAERVEYKRKLEETEGEVANLRVRLSSSAPTDSLEDGAITQLRFDKEALETKLRKYLSHCQRLEEEKSSILQVLRSSKQGAAFDGDIPKSVVSLCDKLASLEEECEALSKSENQASFYLSEVEQLREHNSTLESQISDSRKRVDRLVRSEIELKESLTSLRLEQDELRVRADRAQGTAESLENEKSRQVRYLEQENLQLMIDLKAIKKQLQNAKAELNMLRAKALDDDTMDTIGLPPPATTQARSKPKVKVERAAPSTPHDKENNENVEHIASAKSSRRGWGSNLKTRRTPGLGESLEQNEENTQECKQS